MMPCMRKKFDSGVATRANGRIAKIWDSVSARNQKKPLKHSSKNKAVGDVASPRINVSGIAAVKADPVKLIEEICEF